MGKILQFGKRKKSKAINIVIYDQTHTNPPKSILDVIPNMFENLSNGQLTFWWKMGGLLNKIKGDADLVIGVTSWNDAFKKILSKTNGKKIGSLQFWGHGSVARPLINGKALGKNAYSRTSPYYKHIKEISSRMDKKNGSVWFRMCEVFRTNKGIAYSKAAADCFGVPAVGHTFIIHALQSGTCVRKPHSKANWDASFGTSKNKKHKGEAMWSDPFRKRTVTMFQFYPPLKNSGLLSINKLVSVFNDLISGALTGKKKKTTTSKKNRKQTTHTRRKAA